MKSRLSKGASVLSVPIPLILVLAGECVINSRRFAQFSNHLSPVITKSKPIVRLERSNFGLSGRLFDSQHSSRQENAIKALGVERLVAGKCQNLRGIGCLIVETNRPLDIASTHFRKGL